MRAWLILAALALGGCDFKLDILGDSDSEPCRESVPGYCLPDGISIRLNEGYVDLDPGAEQTAAIGGTVPFWVSGGDAGEGLEREVEGGEVVSEEGRGFVVRPLEDTVAVWAAVGELDDELAVAALPVDAVTVAPLEQQFNLAEPTGAPVEFAIARGSEVPVALQLWGAGTRLIDTSLAASGAVASQSRWDFAVVDGSADRIALAITGDSASAAIEIAGVDPAIDSIEVVVGPMLSDPDAPIALSPAGEAAICFTGIAGGRQIAGLAWELDGAGVSQNDGCAYVDRFTSTLTVSAGGVTRSFDLDVE